MFNWLSWFETKDCGLNYFVINWLGMEKESLSTQPQPLWDASSNKTLRSDEEASMPNKDKMLTNTVNAFFC